MKKDLKLICDLLYNSLRAGGVVRHGCYDLSEEFFVLAAEEYLSSNINHLPNLDIILYASWARRDDGHVGRSFASDEERIYLESFLRGEEFWKPELFSCITIESLKKYLSYQPNKKK